MAKKKVSKKANKKANGEDKELPLWKLGVDARADYVAKKYSGLWEAMTDVVTEFELVDPPEARSVSGVVKSRITRAMNARKSEHEAYMAEKKLARTATEIEKLEALLEAKRAILEA